MQFQVKHRGSKRKTSGGVPSPDFSNQLVSKQKRRTQGLPSWGSSGMVGQSEVIRQKRLCSTRCTGIGSSVSVWQVRSSGRSGKGTKHSSKLSCANPHRTEGAEDREKHTGQGGWIHARQSSRGNHHGRGFTLHPWRSFRTRSTAKQGMPPNTAKGLDGPANHT